MVLSKGHVAHRQIVEIPPVRLFKAVHGDIGVLVELSGNAPGEAVQLHAVQLGPGQGLRQKAKEVADAHGGLQHGPRLKAHVLHRLIDGLDHRGAGIMGIEDSGPGRVVFLWGEQLLQLGILLGPLGVVRVKRLGDAAPAHIAGQYLLFLGRSKTALRLDLLQGANGRHIVLIFGFLTASPQVIIGDVEVVPLLGGPGGWRFRLTDLPAVNLHLFRLCFGELYGIIRRIMSRGACFNGPFRRFLLSELVRHLSGDVLLAGQHVLHRLPHIGDGR